jgi:hypothetical protein
MRKALADLMWKISKHRWQRRILVSTKEKIVAGVVICTSIMIADNLLRPKAGDIISCKRQLKSSLHR